MKTIAIAVMAAWVAASVFGATDAERIEALEKKVSELSRKVGVEAPLLSDELRKIRNAGTNVRIQVQPKVSN